MEKGIERRMKATTYRLGSSPLVFAPGIVAWAINGYAFKRDRVKLVNIIAGGWGVPTKAAVALLSKRVPYSVEGEVVVFST